MSGMSLDLFRHTLSPGEASFVLSKAYEFLEEPCSVLSSWEQIAYAARLLEANTRHVDMDSREQAMALSKRTKLDEATSLLPEFTASQVATMKKADAFVRRALKSGLRK
jgi:hypothetical protein